jgi:uncharacterized protein involved in exopolysaccharide biosynthesis
MKRGALLLVLALGACTRNDPFPTPEPRAQFPADQDARIAERIKQAGFEAAMQADLAEANRGLRNDTPPPWMLLAKYVDVLEKRVAELERKQAKAKGE